MPRLSLNEMTTYRWSFEEDVANYASAGIAAIGVWRHKLSDFGEEKGAELLAESGLHVSNLLWAGGFTGSDGCSHRDSIVDGLEAVRLAAGLNADCLVVYSGSRAGHTHRHARRMFVEAVHEMLAAASDLQVDIAIEPMHRACGEEWTFFNSLEDTLDLLNELDEPYLRLVLDTYHIGFEPRAIDLISRAVPYIAVVHLGDGKGPPGNEQNRSRLGEGIVPLGEIIASLEDAGYSGYYDVELIGEEIEASDYHELIRHSRCAFDRLTKACSPQRDAAS